VALIIFTHHAVEQFISRYDRTLTAAAAREILDRHTVTATKSAQKTHGGEYYWDLPELDMRLVTKLDKAQHICVTVVPMQDKFRDLQEALLSEQSLVEEAPGVKFTKHTIQIVVDIDCEVPSDIDVNEAKNKIREGVAQWIKDNAKKHVVVVRRKVSGDVKEGYVQV